MGVLEGAIVAAGALTIAAGLLLALRGLQVAHVRFMAAWCIIFGTSQVVGVLVPTSVLVPYLESTLFASIIGFAIAYPGPTLSARQKWLIVWVFIPALTAGLLGRIAADGDTWTLYDYLRAAFIIGSLLGVPLALGLRAIRTRSVMNRDQLTWILVPLVFWVVHDGLGALLPFMMHGGWNAPEVSLPWGTYMGTWALGFSAVILAAITLGVRSFWLAPESARSARTFAGAVPVFVTVSLIQFTPGIEGEALTAGFPLHSLVDTLFALILFYGIARYGLVDLRLRMRWSVKQGTIAAVFVAAFFAISESASAFLSETSGSAYFGIIGASLLVFAFAPLQRFAERLSVRAVPVSGSAESYLNYRRLHIYRAALEGALADGRVNAWEADALRALRKELQVSEEEHRLLESELMLPRAPGGLPAQAGPTT